MSSRANMGKALKLLLGEEPLLPILTAVLETCRQQGTIVFREVAAQAGDAAAELLLLAWDWKLLLPRRSLQCAEWDDRIMRFAADEQYEMVNVVRFLLDFAVESGWWDTDTAVEALFVHMGETEHARMPELVRRIVNSAGHFSVDAATIRGACVRTGLGDRAGAMIAILKGGGVISPKLLGTGPMEKRHSPVYEVHPAVGRPGL